MKDTPAKAAFQVSDDDGRVLAICRICEVGEGRCWVQHQVGAKGTGDHCRRRKVDNAVESLLINIPAHQFWGCFGAPAVVEHPNDAILADGDGFQSIKGQSSFGGSGAHPFIWEGDHLAGLEDACRPKIGFFTLIEGDQPIAIRRGRDSGGCQSEFEHLFNVFADGEGAGERRGDERDKAKSAGQGMLECASPMKGELAGMVKGH